MHQDLSLPAELPPRFDEYYLQLQALLRRMRRALQRQWRRSLAGIALMLALGMAPALAATINVGESCTLGRAITSANNDIAVASCTRGRGVELFDNFSGYHASRVAQELLAFQNSPINPKDVDIRPIALAIADRCVNANNLGDFASETAQKAFLGFHKVSSFDELLMKTSEARHSLPPLKAHLQAENMRGLICANRGVPPEEMCAKPPTAEEITQPIALRSAPQGFALDKLTGFMIDREDYREDETIALFRFFLEPWGVQVGHWSMGAMSGSTRYNFADVFSALITPPYRREIRDRLTESLVSENKDVACPALKTASRKAFDAARSLAASARLGVAAATAGLPLVSPQGPDLVVEIRGCNGVNGLKFRTSNVGNEPADGFRTDIVFISRASRQQVGHPTVPWPSKQPLLLGPGKWTDLSVGLPKACVPADVPHVQQGCDVFIYADRGGTVKELNEENNGDLAHCAP
jgi:hypothetical protein